MFFKKIISVLLLLLVLFLSEGCSETKKPPEISVIKASDCRVENAKVFYGTVKSQYQSQLGFQAEGKITFLPYSIGDFVKKGAVLARLDGVLYKIKKSEETARLKDNVLQLTKSKNYYKRTELLHQKGAVSDNDRDEAYYAYLTNKQLVEIQKEKLRYLEQEISNSVITAPFDGYISQKTSEIGSYVKEGSPVLTLNGGRETQAEIIVDSSDINELETGKTVIIERNNTTYSGKIKHISQSSADKGGYVVKIYLNGFYENLKDGMSVTVKIPEKSEVLYKIPLSSLVDENGEKYVYKVVDLKNGSRIVEKQKVELKDIENERAQISKGLYGDDIIIKNPEMTKPGATVKL